VGVFDGSADALLSVDFGRVPNGDLLGVVDAIERARRGLDAALVRAVAQADGRKLSVDEGATSTVALLRARLLVNPGEVSTLVLLARRVATGCAATGAALAAGGLTVGHAKVIVETCDALREPLTAGELEAVEAYLIGLAAVLDPRQLAKAAAALRLRCDPDGDDDLAGREARAHEQRGAWLAENYGTPGGRLTADLDAEAFEAARMAIESLAAPRPAEDGTPDPRSAKQRRADALGELFRRRLTEDWLPSTGGTRPQVVVTIPLDTLRRAVEVAVGAAREICTGTCLGRDWLGRCPGHLTDPASYASGTHLSVETARRIACDAEILPAVLGGPSLPLDLGRGPRLATVAQRIALGLAYGGCAFPGCTRPPSWCSAHHIVHWADGGKTDLGNLVLLCDAHHRVIHHDGWRIERADDGELDFIPPYRIDPLQRPRRQPRRQ